MKKCAWQQTILASAILCSVTMSEAQAKLTIQLEASAVDAALGQLSPDGKTVYVSGTSGNVTLQVWAQITNAAPTNNSFGIVQILGAIASTSSMPNSASGAMSPATPAGPFAEVFGAGAVAEFSAIPDGIADLGSASTSLSSPWVFFGKLNSARGEQIGEKTFVTNNEPLGTPFRTITDGYEFLMGTAVLHVTDFGQGSVEMNWQIPALVGSTAKNARGMWTQGDGLISMGNREESQMAVGSPVVLVPEPSITGLLLGGVALLGGRRRRSAQT